ncbi:MAG: ABC transporter ATP-binding protein [Candidatus Dormibacteria bacterium]|jgi:putative ABC transport system ATP-binding protein
MYELKKLSRVYPKARAKVAALSGVDLVIPDGEFITVQGLTGHGKTTFLQMLGALDKPTSGKIIFDGKDLGAMPESQLVDVRAQNFGFIFQNYNLLPTLTAEENVEAALVPLKVPTAERRARSLAALAEVGLAERANHFPPEMSGGEQQRVAIARALVKEPKVILADEPTGNLDEVTSLEIIGLMEKLWKERGMTLVLVTHDTKVARRAPRTAVITKGKLAMRDNRAPRVTTVAGPKAGPSPGPTQASGAAQPA